MMDEISKLKRDKEYPSKFCKQKVFFLKKDVKTDHNLVIATVYLIASIQWIFMMTLAAVILLSLRFMSQVL